MPRGQAARIADGAALRSPPPAIVLYDDHCGMCTENAQRGRRYQRPGALEWLGNSTPEAQRMLQERGILGLEEDTLIVFEGDRVFTESGAIVRSAQGLRWPWRAYAGIRFMPKGMRDAIYRRIAAKRTKHAECRLPTARPDSDLGKPAEAGQVSPKSP